MAPLLLPVILLGLMALIVGCTADVVEDPKKEDPKQEDPAQEEPRYPVTITDANGKEITFTEAVDGIIPIASSAARAISILGKENLIVSTPDRLALETVFFPNFVNLPSVGNRRAPSVEIITTLSLPLNNLIVIARGGPSATALQTSLDGTGVTVVSLDFGNIATVFESLQKLSVLLDAEQRATDYIDFVNTYLDPIKEFVDNIPLADRPSVFFGKLERPLGAATPADITGWLAIGRTGSSFGLIEMAGGIPITSHIPLFSDVTLEFLIASNPDKAVLWTLFNSGYTATDHSEFTRMHGLFAGATGLSEINAVKNNGITVLAVEVAASPHFIISLIALVEAWYPEQFDFDAEVVHQKIIDQFHSVNLDISTQGAFVYNKTP